MGDSGVCGGVFQVRCDGEMACEGRTDGSWAGVWMVGGWMDGEWATGGWWADGSRSRGKDLRCRPGKAGEETGIGKPHATHRLQSCPPG